MRVQQRLLRQGVYREQENSHLSGLAMQDSRETQTHTRHLEV